MTDPITWANETRRLGQLIPWPRNPRQIKSDQAKRLADSFEQFGQVETIAIGPGDEIYNGHQRLNVLMQQHGPDYVVEVRVASRALTEKERERLTVFLHKGAAGEWNFDALAEWDVPDLLEWGFKEQELGIAPTDADWMAAFEGQRAGEIDTVNITFVIGKGEAEMVKQTLAQFSTDKNAALVAMARTCQG